jgi:cyclic beta-1,2-glucan synthetase
MPIDSSRRFSSPYQATPRTHLLSNGNYSVMLTTAASGFSRWRDIALTRWREDPTCDPWGYYIFLRDVFNGHVWSAGYQPIGRESETYEAAFFEDRAEFRRKDGPIRSIMEIIVSPEQDAEVRHISLTNEGRGVREIELTSYSEVVLSPPSADSAHPAFSKMFVQTEFVAERGALLATRRPRDPGPQPWIVHFSSLDGEGVGGLQYETDRARFLGRGHDVRNAASIVDARPLSNSVGTVLDPVLALRRRVRIDPGETIHAAFWTGIGASRAEALSLVDKLGNEAAFQRTKTLAASRMQDQLRDLNISGDDAGLFQELAERILYSDASLRAPRDLLDRNQLGQPTLWTHGISGDLPIVVALIDTEPGLETVKQLLRAQAYWQTKGLAADLVILNTAAGAAAGSLQDALVALIKHDRNVKGAAIPLRADALPSAERDFLQVAARVVLSCQTRPLREQLARPLDPPGAARLRRENSGEELRAHAPQLLPTLEYFNGLGGFDSGAREYVVVDSRALDQRHRQSAIRLSRLRRRFGQHLVLKCAAKPNYALVQ